MSGGASAYRFRIARRTVQGSVLLLFAAGNVFGWTLLRGNLSSSLIAGVLPLTDPFALLQVLAAGSVVGIRAFVGAGIVLVLFGLVAGRSFCGWVCPVNPITDASSWFGNRIGTGGTGGLVPLTRGARYWILGVSLVLSALLGRAAFEAVSPVSLVHRSLIFGAGLGLLAVPAIFLFDLLVAKRGFCGHLCPLGAFYSLITKFSALRVRHDRERCTRCGKCIEACPEPQILGLVGKRTGNVASGECSMCGRCVEICGDHAMKFSLRLFERSL